MKNTEYNSLSITQKELVDSAEEVLKESYNPYSKFSVGAAILTGKNEIITGANVENASYSCTICAERSAITKAYSQGNKNIKSIAIIGKSNTNNHEEVITPCGSCRQMIYEASIVAKNDIDIIMSDPLKLKIIIAYISELLPMAFGPKYFK